MVTKRIFTSLFFDLAITKYVLPVRGGFSFGGNSWVQIFENKKFKELLGSNSFGFRRFGELPGSTS